MWKKSRERKRSITLSNSSIKSKKLLHSRLIDCIESQVVWSGSLSSLNQGANTFTWNGQNQSGNQLADGGVYTLNISAYGGGSAITPTISISGTASAVQVVNGVTNVTVNGTQVPVSSVTGVT